MRAEPADAGAGKRPDSAGLAARATLADATGRLTPAGLAWLRGRTLAAMAELGVGGEVRVRVVEDAEMDAAHQRYSGVEGTTDVLTFDLSESADRAAGRVDADVLVCLDEAERHAARQGHAAERELLLYVVHGVLHCLGHEDHDEAAWARMHDLEDRVLERIGVGATFRRSERSPGPADGRH